ncbi:MAG: UDP-N-acetylglucosamine 4,6-dehydratase [Candidatus Paceibacterota bacterium]
MNILQLIGRSNYLFTEDLNRNQTDLMEKVSSSTFLVIGGAGSIGQAITKEIFKKNPQKLHVVDISENNLVELVRDIRSSLGYIQGEFKTFALDVGSDVYDAIIQSDGKYDYVLNLSALKHVRSEKDPFTLMRMIEVNILNTLKTIQQAKENGTTKYFCVSTDKAANPVNMMGASKRIMELFLMRESQEINISTARFANVAFSDGSLLDSFKKRVEKCQPIVAPSDVRRYFVSKEESGQICLLSALLGENRDIFFPKLNPNEHLISFASIAEEYLHGNGYQVHECKDEEEARELVKTLPDEGKWPCLFTKSDTTGEKEIEEFYMEGETLDMDRFQNLGVVKSELNYQDELLDQFLERIHMMKVTGTWDKPEIVQLFQDVLPNFIHDEKGKYLDSKM